MGQRVARYRHTLPLFFFLVFPSSVGGRTRLFVSALLI